MNIITVKNYKEMSEKAAKIMANQVILKPNSILGFATGSTPIGMYRELINMYQNGDLDFSFVKTFNLDEYYGLDKENKQSYYSFMMNNLFKHINIKKENINMLNGKAKDIEKECLDYEKKIKTLGGVDIQILGIGANGHIGFNEPDKSFKTMTRLVKLDKKTIKDNSRFFSSIEEVPKMALSMGIKTIMMSKKIILLASGEAKKMAVKNAIKGNISPEVPASILQLHRDVTFIIDEKAAQEL